MRHARGISEPELEEGNIDVAHKFTVGQTVDLMHRQLRAAAAGEYEIRRLMPESDPENPCYRVKSVAEKHERVVPESELTLSPRHQGIGGGFAAG
jgi:hypothetical protein